MKKKHYFSWTTISIYPADFVFIKLSINFMNLSTHNRTQNDKNIDFNTHILPVSSQTRRQINDYQSIAESLYSKESLRSSEPGGAI